LGKISDNPGKNCAQRCLTSENGAQRLQKKNEELFWRSHQEIYFVGEGKFVGQKSQNNFSGKFGEIGQKFLRTPKNLLSPTPVNVAIFQSCRYL